VLSAAVAAKIKEFCGFPDAAPDRVCPVAANSGMGVVGEGAAIR
jgi:hypothetical protein